MWRLLLLFALIGCDTEKVVLVDRSGCLACHRPVMEDGTPHGIEEAHPPIDGEPLTCEACHGGDPESRKQSEAHVQPAEGSPRYLKNLTIGELDAVDPAYLRFVNPGDMRVAGQACGEAGCHGDIVKVLPSNQMSTFAGELGVARRRAGIQESSALKAVYDVVDPDPTGEPGTLERLEGMVEPEIDPGETEIGPYQDLYLTKACVRCHLWSFGDNKFPGDFRSSGCSACHVPYSDRGISESEDPTVDTGGPPHPVKHTLTAAVPSETCTHCHYRGGRIGISYQGYREGAGAGLNPPRGASLRKALHGHDADFYVVDEDRDNAKDETPPDVHFTAGMDCIDCHTSHDVHGDGHLYGATALAVEVRCEDCHGTANAITDGKTRLGNRLKQLKIEGDEVTLTTKVKGLELKVPQLKPAIEKASPSSYMHRSMGRDDNGFSHLDEIACHTCHSGWMPNCYGCHVKVDMSVEQRSLITGGSTPGRVTGGRRWVTTDDLVLMIDSEGRVSPSMPAERMFFTAIGADGETLIDNQIRRTADGSPGHGQRTFSPHTVQRWSPFMACDRCHPASDGSNVDKVRLAIGLGTDRFIEVDGEGREWRLDAIRTEAGESLVHVGHDAPEISGPLPQEMVERMLAVEVPSLDCPTPSGVATPLDVLNDTLFVPRCATSGCHDAQTKAGSLDLSPEALPASVVGVPAVAHSATLVVPGDPSASYLLTKITGGDITGARMPTTGEPLEACYEEMVRGWIQAGAR